MILKLKSFTQIGTFIFHKKFLIMRVPVNCLDETRYIFYFDISLTYPTLEVQYLKILSGGVDFIS